MTVVPSRPQRAFQPRALLDVLLLLAFGFLVAARLPRWLMRAGIESQALVTLVTQGSFLLAVWGLLRWRGLGFDHIGLHGGVPMRRFLAWTGALVTLLLLLGFGTEALGMRRDLSAFDPLRGNLGLTVFAMLFYGVLSAGFYEEILYRGYLMHRVADAGSRSTAAWAVGVAVQAAIFGLSHLHQGWYGAAYTAVVSALLSAIYVARVRNLWVLVAAHGIYDALRMLWFHLQLTYGGIQSLAN